MDSWHHVQLNLNLHSIDNALFAHSFYRASIAASDVQHQQCPWKVFVFIRYLLSEMDAREESLKIHRMNARVSLEFIVGFARVYSSQLGVVANAIQLVRLNLHQASLGESFDCVVRDFLH